ncbi:hypothetical protein CAPTEDRAFT_186618 [Capitella teleta]|uniref:Uncharacterized protein n=1 Tax=Capitella teleta TaxID=283909 RepID=R7VL68_CAPTE|nr:hypothetical protein CAPTEDRAFT_186618 [Capitella teleta]|eukprot:ELU17355.1 hypothetical protein CAPTEDRAFT_186618 [Capitella teleta]
MADANQAKIAIPFTRILPTPIITARATCMANKVIAWRYGLHKIDMTVAPTSDMVTQDALLCCSCPHKVHLSLLRSGQTRMGEGRIAKDLLNGELKTGKRKTSRPLPPFKDACKRHLNAADVPTEYRQKGAVWKSALHTGEKRSQVKRLNHWRKGNINTTI